MYRVLCDGLPIYDLRDEELVLIDPKLTLEVNSAGSFSFKMPPNHPQYDLPQKMRSCVEIWHDNEQIFAGRPVSDTSDFYNRKEIVCEGELAYLNDSIQRPAEYHDMTVRGYLETLIKNHNQQVKEVKVAVRFNSQCAGESERFDYLSLYYVRDGAVYAALNKVKANSVAGKTVIVPSNDIYVYWHTDSSVNSYYGIAVDSIELSNGEATLGSDASLPKYTVTEVTDATEIQSAHSPYENSSNLLWHYTYDLPDNYNSQKMFEVGIVTVKDNNDSLYRYTNYNSTWKEIKEDLINDLGGYIRVRNHNGHRYIDYIAEFDNLCSQSIQFGENLLDCTKNVDMTDIATAVIPLGARQEESDIAALEKRLTVESVNNGSDCVVSPEAAAKYGFIAKTVTWDDVTTPEMLLSKGKRWLTDEQFENMVIEVKAVDLHYTDEQIEQFKLFDMVHVHSTPHGLDRDFPLSKMTINLNNPSANTFTLGTTVKTSLTSKTSEAQSSFNKAVETIPVPSAIVEQAVAEATALITAATHGHVVTTANEQLIMDTNDVNTAAKVWRWNLNGLGYSSTGYNGTYATAITMDGWIVGERIAANSISGDKLDITYKTSVTKEIADAEEAARSDAEDYTDGQLKNYYTKSQVETSIKNAKDSVLLSAKETAEQYVDGKLKNYSTSAQIKVTTDAISSEVSKKLNSSELATQIQQNASAVKIAWNNINKYIQFESGELRIYDSANESSQKLVSKYGSYGAYYYYKGILTGTIGTNKFDDYESFRGLVFDLEYNAGYMCWSARESKDASSYTTKLVYYHSTTTGAKKGLHFDCSTYANGNLYLTDNIKLMKFTDGTGVNGRFSFVNSSNTSSCEIDGVSKSFKIFNNVDIEFYSTLNLNGWGYTNNSDARLKRNIRPTAVKGLDVVNGIDLKEFDWIQTGEHQHIGIIAQQLIQTAPELVQNDSKTGKMMLKTDKLVYYCIKAIQELCDRLGIEYDKPEWSDPYTELEKNAFCVKLESGDESKTPVEHHPMQIPIKNNRKEERHGTETIIVNYA